jgi:hypothetical protein
MIKVDLNGGAGGTDATTAFTEQTLVSLFPNATLTTTGSADSNSIDTITISLGSATTADSLTLCGGSGGGHSGRNNGYFRHRHLDVVGQQRAHH